MSNTRPLEQRSHGNSHAVALLVTALSIIAALLLLVNRQYVVDQLTVWQYQPIGAVTQLADRSGMSDTGKFYFYASQPAIETAPEFNKQCGRKEESTAILGCYNGRNIYIYNVTNEQLDGIKEVTAAHEMLHAAYARMSGGEKGAVDKLLEAEYAKLKSNKDFAERFAFYDRTEPGERDNELHSVIGTEVSAVSPELEAHYRAYFSNRSKVLALHDKYASVFAQLQAEGDALSARLTALGNTINQQTKDYNADVITLNNDIEDFNRRANSGGFSSKEEFDSTRASLLARADQLDDMRQTINTEISEYNTLRERLKTVASQSEALNRSIDSSLSPAPSLK
jgi:hypothetical protein